MDNMYPLAGALTGFIVGLTGVGGGALMTPILLLLFGVAPTTAVATDLWFATITKVAALLVHQANHQVDWQVVKRLWAGSLPAALLVVGLLLSGLLTRLSSSFLTSAIGCMVLLTALGILTKRSLLSCSVASNVGLNPYQKPLTLLAGAVIGLLVALTSVGAGVLGTLMLFYLYSTRLTPGALVGTDIAHAIPLAFVAGLGYLYTGYVDFRLLRALLVTAVPFAVLGSLMASKLNDKKLRVCLAVVLSYSGLRLML